MLRKTKRILIVASLLLTLIWLSAWIAARLLIVTVPLEHGDAILVLSGSSTTRERAQHAAQLYSQKRSRKILLTTDDQRGGWSEALQRNPFSYEYAIDTLVMGGVDRGDIELLPTRVNSTWDEAKLIDTYVKEHQLRSIIVVTSAYHSRRAFWTFQRFLAGRGVQIGIDPVPTGIQTPSPSFWWLYGRGWKMVFAEYFKLVYYRFRVL